MTLARWRLRARGAPRGVSRRREAERAPVEDGLVRPRHDREDHGRAARQCGAQQRPDLLGLPGCEGDDRPSGEVLLQELEGLGIGVRRPVLAGLQPRVRADEHHRPVGASVHRGARLVADAAGSQAERIFILNMLPDIIRDISGSVGDMKIDVALKNSFGFGGTNGTLVFKRI